MEKAACFCANVVPAFGGCESFWEGEAAVESDENWFCSPRSDGEEGVCDD